MQTFAMFIHRAILQGTPLLFGSCGEILTEKSGHLNLGIPGIMYMGAISGVIGGFYYQNSVDFVQPFLAIIIPLVCSLIGSLFASAIYAFLTVTLRANQNVTGLVLTTFGVGFGNFFGGSLIKLSGADVPYLALTDIAAVYKRSITFPKEGFIGIVSTLLFEYGFLVFLAPVLAIVMNIILKKTRIGLNLRAVGEAPGTADAAGINVTKYKWISICAGGMISGLGGLYYIMDYTNGIWSNNGFGDRGWLAIALVIFALWDPIIAIVGSYLFGGLYILGNYISVPTMFIPIMEMAPYIVTLAVLILVSVKRRKKANGPPAALGISYFREER